MKLFLRITELMQGISPLERLRKAENFYVLYGIDATMPCIIRDKDKQENAVLVFGDVKKAEAFVKKYGNNVKTLEIRKYEKGCLATFLREVQSKGIDILLISKNRNCRGYDISKLIEE